MPRLPSRRVRYALLAVLVVAAFFVGRRLSRPERPQRSHEQESPEPVIVRNVTPQRTTEEGSGILGINEGISLPSDPMLKITGGEKGLLGRRVVMLKGLGTRLVRANSHSWPFLNFHQWKGDWTAADEFMRTTGDAGLDAVVVIGPWPGTRTALYTERYLPDDLDAYAAWVEQVVERYDGDGIDDMPGLRRKVLAWEVDNEPDQHNKVSARGTTDEEKERGKPFETPREYATVLITTATAIRRADPDAMVLSGGLYRAAMPIGREYLERVLNVPGAREAIDGLSLHCYFTGDDLGAVQRTMRTAHALAPDLPVWITETSVPSEADPGWVDEAWQAKMVAGIVGAFLAEGADRIFWHSLTDAPNDREGPTGYSTNSLFRAVRDDKTVRYEPKPAAEVFERLVGHLSGVHPGDVAEIPAEGGRLLETDTGWLAFDGEPAVPPEARLVENLVTGEVEPASERALAPAWITR